MKVVILAGGRGTRLSEETRTIPKPMVPIGGRPIIWHIMKHYARHGFDDFVVACGYKGYALKEYFANYRMYESDLTVDLGTGQNTVLAERAEKWRVTLVDTGVDTMTGGRLGRLAPILTERFMLTYGDGLGNVPLDRVLEHHERTGALATVTAVSPPPRFGTLRITDGLVTEFAEKPLLAKDRINGGFFVVEPEVLGLLDGDDCVFEGRPLERLADDGRLAAYVHDGFWMPMDTLRDRDELDRLAQAEVPPWTA
ncbi:glucose-1-phosphate cytidylyltransferase [Marmoricola sp. RAF53]|uniref:glucose-1-phosphate cytidylyltransferase n=1 Tax=Marmoricola sp. RAF53 TaxID=3233059 RepID=UPI003F959E74